MENHNMKDILQDVVAHTHALGFLTLVKVSNDEGTTIDAMAEDRSVILTAEAHTTVAEFTGTFGMPNLDKLALHLKNPEYQKDAKIDVLVQSATVKLFQHIFTLKTQQVTLKMIIAL